MQDNFMSIRCDFVTSSDYKTAVTRRDPCPRGLGIQQLGQMFFLKPGVRVCLDTSPRQV